MNPTVTKLLVTGFAVVVGILAQQPFAAGARDWLMVVAGMLAGTLSPQVGRGAGRDRKADK